MKGVRRVVTGVDENGRNLHVSDAAPPLTKNSPALGGWAVDLWEMASIPPRLSDDGGLTTGGGFPPSGSLVFRMISMPAESTMRANLDEAAEYYGGSAPDLDSPEFGMHRSDTVDLIVVLSGEVYSVMQGGDEALLKAGDTLIQRGTTHTWRNRGPAPCVMAAVLVGTPPA